MSRICRETPTEMHSALLDQFDIYCIVGQGEAKAVGRGRSMEYTGTPLGESYFAQNEAYTPNRHAGEQNRQRHGHSQHKVL